MKTYFVLILIFALLFLMACGSEKMIEPTTETTETTTTFPITRDPEQITFLPEDISPQGLIERERNSEFRYVYYFGAPPEVLELFPIEVQGVYFQLRGAVEGWPDEMVIVTLLRLYDIQRETFEDALQRAAERMVNMGWMDLSTEVYELPNPAIIFTFDNEIIDAFYRRESPVVPDWDTLVTWESYSAFRAANPE